MVIKNCFKIGEIVYLVTDVEQKPRLVYSVEVFKDESIVYRCASGTTISTHYDFEMSRDKDILLSTTN